MVVMWARVECVVSTVRLYNKCSSSYLRVEPSGRVLADQQAPPYADKYQKLKIFSLGFNNTLVIYAEESEQYLCFNKKWKLIGTKNTSKHHCGFYEKMMDTGYFRYMSTANGSRYIGFNKKGRPLRNNNPVLQQQQRPRCYDFIKCDSKFSVEKHNAKKGGGTILNRTAEPLGTGKRRRQHPIRHHRHRQTT